MALPNAAATDFGSLGVLPPQPPIPRVTTRATTTARLMLPASAKVRTSSSPPGNTNIQCERPARPLDLGAGFGLDGPDVPVAGASGPTFVRRHQPWCRHQRWSR